MELQCEYMSDMRMEIDSNWISLAAVAQLCDHGYKFIFTDDKVEVTRKSNELI